MNISVHPTDKSIVQGLIDAAESLGKGVDKLKFADPVTHVYNPLRYAWESHCRYLERANKKRVRVLFLGMNPGPWGMAQTGVPFGEVDSVRDWLGIDCPVKRPKHEHPKRPIEGMNCQRSEVSGRRLWGLFKNHYGTPRRFFRECLVLNYCPLVFMESTGRNRTPDKLSMLERRAVEELCDRHLATALRITKPAFAVGIGAYAENALKQALPDSDHSCPVVRILHPSPASPAANRDWDGTVHQQLQDAGIW